MTSLSYYVGQCFAYETGTPEHDAAVAAYCKARDIAEREANASTGKARRDLFDLGSLSRNIAKPIGKPRRTVDGLDMTPPPASALDTAGAPLTSPQQTRKARETTLYQRTDARRQATDKQITDLKRSLDADLAYIRNCIARGARDTALRQMRQAIRKQDRILELADKWTRIMAADAVKAAFERPRPPSKLKVERKVRRYKTWSDV